VDLNSFSEPSASDDSKTKGKRAPDRQQEAEKTEAIETLVNGGLKALFLGIGTFMRPQWALPAWSLDDDDLKRPTEHFSRFLKVLSPEQAVLLSKYGEPIVGCFELYAVYRAVLRREVELYEYLVNSGMVAQDQTTPEFNPASNGASAGSGFGTVRPDGTGPNAAGRFRPTG
jgi:hypothetical protein